MPNHVWTNLDVQGSPADIAAFKARFCETLDEQENCLVFNRVIPMPEELKIECGSESSLGFSAVSGDYKALFIYPWIMQHMRDEQLSNNQIEALKNSRIEFLNWLAKYRPKAVALGHQVASNLEKYGHETWYEWSIENWGTKWDAYNHAVSNDCTDTKYLCYFETAWSPAFPVLEAMSEAFPDLNFRMAYADEGGGFAGIAHCGSDGFTDEDGDYRQICIDEFGHSEDDFYDDDQVAANDSEANPSTLKLVVNHE